jgi:hypothetical protein
VAQAAVPIVLGLGGFSKLGGFHWGIFLVMVVLSAFAYHSGYHRAKYGTPPLKSALLGDIRGQPPQR